ncbi:MAG: hypothetical protein ACYDA1_02940 [Vulcanimicrobiaceae bacterium]
MNYRTFLIGAAVVALMSSSVAQAAPTSPAASRPIRTLTYSFRLTRNSSGTAPRSAPVAASGTIAVAVVQVAPDTGLAVTVQEDAGDARSTKSATCAVYGNGTVLCDPKAKIYSEALTLLRILGRNFIDPTQIDAKNSWKLAVSNPTLSMSSTFTIRKNDNGMLAIDESRSIVQKGPRASTTSITGKILYDLSKTLPLSISEKSVQRMNVRAASTHTVTTQIIVKLTSDSLGAKLP